MILMKHSQTPSSPFHQRSAEQDLQNESFLRLNSSSSHSNDDANNCCSENSLSISHLTHTNCAHSGDSFGDIQVSHCKIPSSSALSIVSFGAPDSLHDENDLFGISSEVENYFTHDFRCCGMHLKDMHESLLHYEMYHVRDERNNTRRNSDHPSTSSTVLKETTAGNRQDERSFHSAGLSGQMEGQDSQSFDNASSSNAQLRGRQRLFLDVESNDNPRLDPYKIAAFDDTIIRERNPYYLQGHNNRQILSSAANVKLLKDYQSNESKFNSRLNETVTSHVRTLRSSDQLKSTQSRENRASAESISTSGEKTMELEFFPDTDEDLEFETEEDSILRKQTMKLHYNGVGGFIHRMGSYRSTPTDLSADDSIKPYACTYPGCTKTYKNPNGLKYHAIHGHKSTNSDADKPYECTFYGCDRRFKNPNGLKYHLVHFHKPSDLQIGSCISINS